MPISYATDGAFAARQGGNDLGGACTGIGVGPNQSGPSAPGNFSDGDFAIAHIGGQAGVGFVLLDPVTFVGGSGYTNGTYVLPSSGGGKPDGTGALNVTVSGGAITAASVARAGSFGPSSPSFPLAPLGAGSGGSLTVNTGTVRRAVMLGAAYGNNKTARRVTATAPAPDGANVNGSGFINRSGRPMAIGDSAWCVSA